MEFGWSSFQSLTSELGRYRCGQQNTMMIAECRYLIKDEPITSQQAPTLKLQLKVLWHRHFFPPLGLLQVAYLEIPRLNITVGWPIWNESRTEGSRDGRWTGVYFGCKILSPPIPKSQPISEICNSVN